jgi:lipopolysaccharide export LptBFGC system permease protein LptF
MSASLRRAQRFREWFAPLSAWRLDIYTSFMLRHYLWFVLVTIAAIVGAVTAINVSPEVTRVWREGGGSFASLSRTAAYIFFRLLDNGSQVFPIAFLLGIVWGEVAHAASGRLVMIRTVGMKFARRNAAFFILAGLSMPVQFLLDNVVRPYAYMSLSLQGLGEYGWKYRADRLPQTRWLAFGSTVLQITLQDDPQPRLGPATFYTFDAKGNLAEVAEAHEIVPVAGSDARWRLREGRVWSMTSDDNHHQAGPRPAERADPAANLRFSISPLWLRYRDIEPKYVPLSDLVLLAEDANLPDNPPKYSAWLEIRISQAFVPGLVALCISTLFALVLDGFGLVAAVGAGLMASYLGYFLTRIAAIAIENSLGPPILTASILPLFLLATSQVLLIAMRRKSEAG